MTRRISGLVVNVLLSLVTLAALAFVAPGVMGYERYVITGRSMTGSYDLGSLVYEEVVPVEDLRVGDVITYVPPAESGIRHLVTHRIVSIDGSQLRTQGDAVGHVDPWTFELTAATQPRVAFSVPYAGLPILALRDRETRMLALGAPAALVFLLALAELLGLGRRTRRPAPLAQGESA